MSQADEKLAVVIDDLVVVIDDLVAANHILFQQGVVDGFGHVSARHPGRSDRFLLARNMAPAQVRTADILEFELDGTPVDPSGPRPYLERFIHGEIYRARADVMGVVHSHSPAVVPFGVVPSAPLRPICHMSGFLGEAAPVFEIRDTAGPATDMLIRTPALGVALADRLGPGAVVLMRGHGSTVVGTTVRQAVFRAVYTEVNAKLQAEALRLGPPIFLTGEEAAAAAATNDGQIDRAWNLWLEAVNDPSA
ncbi:MAG TPA: class II aldolase/adducin family protein [Aliidongia sp.]|uniref:class II aldolase/adducin family protein n=1 Tax=Aliidongia sp. TaxID=1914230 RepID=UPI002DDD776D|nr:class II aldolase/adducin family protein [Aliidongia sp.]HEV2677060.1 class II aldolase/adducin family protein [Aliidongia sp.]